jgi:hypothetical protein
MDINFCEQCDMKLDYYESDDQTLYLGCKVCGFQKEHNETFCIYNNDYEVDLSQIINKNKFLEHDITLPVITNNKNIKCPNSECKSITEKKPSEIIYIKYDHEKLKFSYICKHCKQVWTNQ